MDKIRKLTVCSRYTLNDSKVPSLSLVGKWLKEAGFDIGCKVEVECKEGELIIRRSERYMDEG